MLCIQINYISFTRSEKQRRRNLLILKRNCGLLMHQLLNWKLNWVYLIQKNNEKSKERKHLKKEILRVLKNNNQEIIQTESQRIKYWFLSSKQSGNFSRCDFLRFSGRKRGNKKKLHSSVVIFFLFSFRDIFMKSMSNETLYHCNMKGLTDSWEQK